MTTAGRLTRAAVSATVTPLGWRLVLNSLITRATVASLAEGIQLAADVSTALGDRVGNRLAVDVTAAVAEFRLQDPASGWVTDAELALAQAITRFLGDHARTPAPLRGDAGRSVQQLEICVDALDVPAVRPFWRAVLGYADEGTGGDPGAAVIDPAGRGPSVWFQQMDAPRPQRNRIHFDISVPHDEAERRLADVRSAGGRIIDDSAAPAFWVCADPEGNEVCVCTWQARD